MLKPCACERTCSEKQARNRIAQCAAVELPAHGGQCIGVGLFGDTFGPMQLHGIFVHLSHALWPPTGAWACFPCAIEHLDILQKCMNMHEP